MTGLTNSERRSMAVPAPSLRPRSWPMRAHLAFFALALVLPILAFAGLLVWQYGTGERTRLEQAALVEARDIARAVDGELGDLLSSAQILALSPAVRHGRFDDFHQQIQDIRQTLGIICVLRSPDGLVVVSPTAPLGASRPRVLLAPDQAVLTTKQPQISDLFTGAVTQMRYFAVTVPVLRDDGEISYLLDLSFPVERLKNTITQTQPPTNWVVAIVDRSGTIMARNGRHEDYVGTPATPDLQENTREREGTWDGFAADGRAVFGAYARSQLADWRIAVGVERTDLTAPLWRSLWWLAAIGGGLLAISALLAWLFGQRITAPIQVLAHKAAAVGQGEAVSPVMARVSEIRQVGEALAAAAAKLHSRETALRESEERLRRAIEAGQMAVWETDLQTGKVVYSPEANQLFGFPAEASPSIDEFRARYYPGERERTRAAFQAALEQGERYVEYEYRCVWPDGQHRWLLRRGEVLPASDGAPSKVVGVLLDITNRKRWEEQQQLLIHELNHRVKNTLATVQSIASQTLRNVDDTAAARLAIEARLLALSRAHDVLTRENWEAANLQEVVAQAVEPYRTEGEDRLHFQGPPVRVLPRMALALAMALQELATNAVKYGALSNTSGEVRITWAINDSTSPARLHLRWEESGGPPVQPPTRRGFGTRLIERSLAQELNGDAHLEFAPAGVVCTVDAPIQKS